MFSIYNKSINFSGNNTTLNRLSNILNIPITTKIKNNIIGIHAFKFGNLVLNKNINFILIIGGTDLNIDIHDDNKKAIIKNVCHQAKYIITFNNYLLEETIKYTNISKDKIFVIPQSIKKINIKSNFEIKLYCMNKFNLYKINKIFIMVGNIRKIKDVLFLEKSFRILSDQNIYLFIFGNNLDNIKPTKGIYFAGPLNYQKILASYSQVDGLINTSISEGMSISILEAMINKCPIYARNNKSNLDLITHNENGFVFKNNIEFKILINKNTDNIVENSYNYVLKNHNEENEKKLYKKLLNS